jgi:hypothetical protein
LRHLAPLLLLVGLSLLTFGHLAELRPFDADSLKPLSWAARANGFDWIRGNPLLHPEWRPLAYLTIWTQYQMVGISNIGSYFIVNFVLWTLCATSIYGLVFLIARSHLGALLAALLFLVDRRVIDNHILVITGRQSTLACSLGMAAIIVTKLQVLENRGTLKGSIISGFLLAAALSKEPGLAFSFAVIVLAYFERNGKRRVLLTSALASIVTYFALRFIWAGGAIGNYCEDMGFFQEVRNVCFNDLNWTARVQQSAYNATAMFLGTFLPGLFARMGELRVRPEAIVFSSIWLALALVAWLKAPRATLPMLALILLAAVANFALYRSRNQIYGMMGLYTSFGVGVAFLLAWARQRRIVFVALVAIAPFFVNWTADSVRTIQRAVRGEVNSMRAKDPCIRMDSPRSYEATLIVALKEKYQLSDPNCETRRASQFGQAESSRVAIPRGS